MRDKKTIDRDIAELETLKSLVKVYGEVATNRMNKTRKSVLLSRQFLDQLNEVFTDARVAYLKKYMEEQRGIARLRKKKITLLSHNGLTVAVLLSANTRLYGDLVQRTFERFIGDVKSGSEATIIGKVGLSLYREELVDRPYTYFDFPDHTMDEKALAEIVKHLVQYEKINVYYGKFKNVIQQEPTKFSMSAVESSVEEQDRVERTSYYFEPTLEDVLRFFEKEIFGTLFDQTIRESQLAKFASRLVAMDKAEQNITEKIKKTEVERLRVAHQISNRKQLNAMSSIIMRFVIK